MFSKGYRRWGSCSSEAIEDIEVYTEVGVTRSSDCTAFVPLFTFRISIPIRVSEAFDNFSTRNCFRNLKTFHGPFDGLRVSSSATLRLCDSGQTTRAKTLRQRAVSYTSDTVWAFGWYKKIKNEKAEKWNSEVERVNSKHTQTKGSWEHGKWAAPPAKESPRPTTLGNTTPPPLTTIRIARLHNSYFDSRQNTIEVYKIYINYKLKR